MKYDPPLVTGRLVRRYKRFLADVELDNGEVVVAHTANTGAMTGCSQPGSRVWLSKSDNPRRKCKYTWELVETREGVVVGINTLHANVLVEEAIKSGQFPFFNGYSSMRREASYGQEGSRIDFLLQSAARPPCYLEVKNVTLASHGVAFFPDAVSVRGQKHLRELESVVTAGDRALLCFCIQRHDVSECRPADSVDSEYGRLLRQVVKTGVDVVAIKARPDVRGVSLETVVPVNLFPQRGR